MSLHTEGPPCKTAWNRDASLRANTAAATHKTGVSPLFCRTASISPSTS